METIQAPDTAAAIARMQQPMPINTQVRLMRLYFKTVGQLAPRRAARVAWRVFQTPRYRARHKQTDALIEGATRFHFFHHGKSVTGYSWGKGNKTALLVHGWESRGTALRAFVPPLVAEGYRVVAFDGPAHGDSPGKQTNLLEFADLIRHIIREVGGVDTIIAHSFGGFATGYLFMNSHAANLTLRRFVMLGSPIRMQSALEGYTRLLGIPPRVFNQWLRLIRHRAGVRPEDVDIATHPKPQSIGRVLVVHDLYDEMVQFKYAEELAAKWADTTLVRTEGYGHNQLLKATPVIDRVMRFVVSN